MGFFDSRENIERYIKMAEGYDGRELIDKLRRYVPDGGTVLELGMGPGKDLDILSQWFTVTGSDVSTLFIDLYFEKNPDADLLVLDAVSLDTDRVFQCIYSNKVLHHLSPHELAQSFTRQRELLSSGGIALHSFWKGDGEETIEGMRFTYYQTDTLRELAGEVFDVVECSVYAEMEANDSICLIVKK